MSDHAATERARRDAVAAGFEEFQEHLRERKIRIVTTVDSVRLEGSYPDTVLVVTGRHWGEPVTTEYPLWGPESHFTDETLERAAGLLVLEHFEP